MKIAGTLIVILVGVLALGWVFMGNELAMYSFFAPQKAKIERKVFEGTRSFNQGMIQELENMQMDYIKGTPEQKVAMRSVILHRASGYNLDDSDVPSSLRQFIENLKENE